MVLKFCGASWGEEPATPVAASSNHDSDEERGATVRRRSQTARVWAALLSSAGLRVEARADDSKPDVQQRWEKEIRLRVDGQQPVGLGFRPASGGGCSSEASTAGSYTCVVRDVAMDGLAASHNARCRAAGDYSRVLVPKLRVRMVNDRDVAGLAYADVLQLMRETQPPLLLTLADVRSGLATPPPERSKSLSSLSTSRQTRRRSSLSSETPRSLPRRVSCLEARLSSKSEGLQPPEPATSPCSEQRSSELEALETELHALRRQLSELQRERHDAGESERERERELAELASRTRRERDDMIAVNKLLLRHKRASAATQAELAAVRGEHSQLEQRETELQRMLETLQPQLEAQTKAAHEASELATQLAHEKDLLALRWHELQEEHRDALSHVDELHDRLVEAQRAHRAVESMLSSLRTAHAAQTDALRALQAQVDAHEAAASATDTAEGEIQVSSTAASRRVSEAVSVSGEELAERASREQQLQQQLQALELVNATSKRLLGSLHEDLRAAQGREVAMRAEFTVELDAARHAAAQSRGELQARARELEQERDAARLEQQRLERALDALEASARARVAAHAQEQEALSAFKRTLTRGVVVTSFGARGVPHVRVLYSDAQCHWLSWRAPPTAVTQQSAFSQPKADAKADTCDLVAVLTGPDTPRAARQHADASRSFSLVLLRPCRTLDLQTDTPAQCQQLVRGFRLLQGEAALKRS